MSTPEPTLRDCFRLLEVEPGCSVEELKQSYRDLYKPFHKAINDWLHRNSGWKTFIHSCGSVVELIPDFIDAGFDILNPVQTAAAGMDPKGLKERFGEQIVFWGGGCDTQKVLPLGTPEEVRDHVRHNIEVFSAGEGGYVFTQVHNIQQDVPVENVEAMFEAAYEFGRLG